MEDGQLSKAHSRHHQQGSAAVQGEAGKQEGQGLPGQLPAQLPQAGEQGGGQHQGDAGGKILFFHCAASHQDRSQGRGVPFSTSQA